MGGILDWLRLSDCAGEVILVRDRLPYMVMIPLLVLGGPNSLVGSEPMCIAANRGCSLSKWPSTFYTSPKDVHHSMS
jgi:hypothetical protein